LPGLLVLDVTEVDGELEVHVETTADRDWCRVCQVRTSSHGRRSTLVRDLPVLGVDAVAVAQADTLRHVYRSHDAHDARTALDVFNGWAADSSIAECQQLARTVRRWQAELLAARRCSSASTAARWSVMVSVGSRCRRRPAEPATPGAPEPGSTVC